MRHTRLSMRLREREEPRNVSFMLIPAGAALRLTTMLSLLISPADVVVTSCWYTCRPNLVAQGLRLSEVYTVKRSSSLYAACTGGDGRTDGRTGVARCTGEGHRWCSSGEGWRQGWQSIWASTQTRRRCCTNIK